jgi:hypothetical protein
MPYHNTQHAPHGSLEQLTEILRTHPSELLKKLGLKRAQLSMPVDGKGIRIRVSVSPPDLKKVPREIPFQLDSQAFNIPLEAIADYSDIKALAAGHKL